MRSRIEFYTAKARQAEKRAAQACSADERLDYLFVARQWWEVATDTAYLEQGYRQAWGGGRAHHSAQYLKRTASSADG
jgi:hypothetical protein